MRTARSPLFDFRLREIEQIVPWGTPGNETLSWFGLTDGWYWMALGGDELFRYREAQDGSVYVDYQVVRLWEDILSILPAVLETVPDDIARRLEPAQDWLSWRWRVQTQLIDSTMSDAESERRDLATRWSADRRLDSLYLPRGPQIWLWRTSDVVHVAWDNHDCVFNGEPVWASAHGHGVFSVAEFIGEVEDFNRRLVSAMADRVKAVRKGWPFAKFDIDVDQLEHEQKDRSTWLSQALDASAKREPTDWASVRDELNALDQLIGP